MSRREPFVAQQVLSVMARIDKSRKCDLEDTLRRIRSDWYGGHTSLSHLSPLRDVRSVHFARFVIIEPNFDAGPIHAVNLKFDDEFDDYVPFLLFETWYDGALVDHLDELLDELPDHSEQNTVPMLDTIKELFEFCPEFELPPDNTKDYVRRFLKKNNFKHEHSNAPYVAARGRSAAQIKDERFMYGEIKHFFDERVHARAWRDRDAVSIHNAMRDKFVSKNSDGDELITVGKDKEKRQMAYPPPQLKGAAAAIDRSSMGGFLIALLGAVAALVVGTFVIGVIPSIAFLALQPTPGWAWGPAASYTIIAGFVVMAYLLFVIRWHEKRDEQYKIDLINPYKYVRNEDHVLQNPMTSAIPIKHCAFRLYLLRVVLALTRWFAQYRSTRGRLSGISSIHFARWAVVGEPPLLLFTSNYNRSWESYIGEFVDAAARGLTLIWTNAQGFPRTRWLFTEGAANEQYFKAYVRESMAETQLWFSAYWDITVLEILRNTEIRRGLLTRKMNADEAQAWVELL